MQEERRSVLVTKLPINPPYPHKLFLNDSLVPPPMIGSEIKNPVQYRSTTLPCVVACLLSGGPEVLRWGECGGKKSLGCRQPTR